jgi:hypothetical protein
MQSSPLRYLAIFISDLCFLKAVFTSYSSLIFIQKASCALLRFYSAGKNERRKPGKAKLKAALGLGSMIKS